ncbi:MAG: glycosyltransferase family 1 protein, partial [Patescibacteria group bacterium]
MDKKICIYDPIIDDQMSKVRGIGRYLKLLKSSLKDNAIFTNTVDDIPKDCIFINPFFNFFAPPLISKKQFIKQIAVIHDVIPLKYRSHFPVGIMGSINFLRNKKSLSNYDLIITDSDSSKADIIKILKVDEQKIKVVYPTLSNDFLKIKERKPSFIKDLDEKYLIYVGDATWNKNLLNIAKAIKSIGIKAVFVGKVFQKKEDLNHSWQRQLKSFLNLTKDDSNFIFPGFVSDNELVWLYKNSVCNLLVSHDEGFGFSFIEAGSQKTPSVLSDILVFKEIAQDNALFSNNNEWKNIADNIKRIIDNPSLRETLGEEAYERSRFFTQDS